MNFRPAAAGDRNISLSGRWALRNIRGKGFFPIAVGLTAGSIGVATVTGGQWPLVAVGIVLLGLALLAITLNWSPPHHHGYLAVELPVLLLLLSTLVLRVRGSDELASNPLDLAGMFRAGCAGMALLLGGAALLFGKKRAGIDSRTSRPFRLYALYTLVVFAAVPLSVYPLLTAYRGLELVAGIIVLFGASQTVGTREAVLRIKKILFWLLVALVVSVWLGVILSPAHAFRTLMIPSPLPIQIQGVQPAMASNTVGFFSVLLGIWALVRLLSRNSSDYLRPSLAVPLVILSAITLTLTQYRTGYVAAVAAGLVLLALRARKALIPAVVVVITAFTLWGNALISEGQSFALRGQTPDQVVELSSRRDWWSAAVPVWERSPIVGVGLLTGSRFEVFAPLGNELTSTLHGGWIEALVGTGVVGATLLGLSVLVSWRRSVAGFLKGRLSIEALALLTVLTVRSVTATTFEGSNYASLLFLTLALGLTDVPVLVKESLGVRRGTPARFPSTIPQTTGMHHSTGDPSSV